MENVGRVPKVKNVENMENVGNARNVEKKIIWKMQKYKNEYFGEMDLWKRRNRISEKTNIKVQQKSEKQNC